MMSPTTAFKAATKTFAVAMTTTGSTGVQIVGPQGTGALTPRTDQYYVVNGSTGYLFFTLDPSSATVAVSPAPGVSSPGYMLPPSSAGVFSGPENAYFSGDLDTGTGIAYVCGGSGL